METTHIKRFLSHHRLLPPEIPILVEAPISSLFEAQHIFGVAFSQAPIVDPRDGIWLRALQHLTDRVFEFCDGALVCLSTGATAGAEPLARAAIEGSVNLLYICKSNHEEKLFGFFFEYLNDHKKKLRSWQSHVATTTNDPGVLSMIQSREEARISMEEFMENLRGELSLPDPEKLSTRWPGKFFNRCEQLGMKEDYFTSYHRLSASSHMNAEDTIGYLMGYFLSVELGTQKPLESIGTEAIFYASLMTRIAILHYIDASEAACRTVGAVFDCTAVERLRSDLRKGINQIAKNAGCPTI